jgi:ankyrin repeat protein
MGSLRQLRSQVYSEDLDTFLRALQYDNPKVVERFLSSESTLSFKDLVIPGKDMTVLQEAAAGGHSRVLKVLVNFGADLHKTTNSVTHTPLTLSCIHDRRDCFNYLLKSWNPMGDRYYFTCALFVDPLTLSIEIENREYYVEQLLHYNNVHFSIFSLRAYFGYSLFRKPIERNDVNLCEILLKYPGFDLNERCDDKGGSLLHYAVRQKSFEVACVLIAHGAKTSEKNYLTGETVDDIIRKLPKKTRMKVVKAIYSVHRHTRSKIKNPFFK